MFHDDADRPSRGAPAVCEVPPRKMVADRRQLHRKDPWGLRRRPLMELASASIGRIGRDMSDMGMLPLMASRNIDCRGLPPACPALTAI